MRHGVTDSLGRKDPASLAEFRDWMWRRVVESILSSLESPRLSANERDR